LAACYTLLRRKVSAATLQTIEEQA